MGNGSGVADGVGSGRVGVSAAPASIETGAGAVGETSACGAQAARQAHSRAARLRLLIIAAVMRVMSTSCVS
ncbi:MAG: hypothetical protein ROW39_10580 [Anaerolineaceae bacterium]